jgi:hypothetical protein
MQSGRWLPERIRLQAFLAVSITANTVLRAEAYANRLGLPGFAKVQSEDLAILADGNALGKFQPGVRGGPPSGTGRKPTLASPCGGPRYYNNGSDDKLLNKSQKS